MKAQSARRITCPRCATPVTGTFKFCPACAYRLQPGDAAEPTVPVVGSRLGPALLVTGALVVVAGFLAFGFMLFGADGKEKPTVPTVARLQGALAVRDIPDEMVSLEPGTAYFEGERPNLAPKRVGRMGIMRHEVTRGQWAEFARDVQAHPEKIPKVIREMVWRNAPYARRYVDAWWEMAEARLGIPRPESFEPPLADHVGVLLLVPPSWTRVTEWDEIEWEVPSEEPLSENVPVTEVSWWDAITFAEWATAELDSPNRIRLPSAREWIRAAHGNDPRRLWPWGDEPFPYASNTLNFWSGGGGRPLPVDFVYRDGASGVTTEGVWGMAGNAAEWTYPDPEEEGAPVPDLPLAPRYGGSFLRGLDDCQVESLMWDDKRDRFADSGFRLMIERP